MGEKGDDNMLSYQYHRVLRKIAEETYPDKKILSFQIEIHSKEMKSRHGDYSPSKRVIRIFNLSQKTDYTIATALHELAHHCEFSLYGNTGHSKQFYKVFKELLETAVAMNIIAYEDIRNQEDASDIKMLEKHFGAVNTVAKSVNCQEESVIKVLNSFSFRDKLKDNKYFYDPVEKAWGKIIPTAELEIEKEFLSKHTSSENLVVRSLYDLHFEAIYYLFVPNGFDKRDALKNDGYFYKVYKKKKGWAKRIISTELNDEKRKLQNLSISDFQVTSSLK